jgi:hypothetical protein
MAISSDDYIDHEARLQGKTYTEVFDKAVGPANVAIEADAKAAKMLGANVVWDQTNLTVKKRKIILDKFKDYDKVCVYFPIPNDWYNRLDKRAEVEGKLIPHNVLGSMQDCFESPRLSEGFSWIHTPESFLKYFENLMVSN